MKTGSRRVHSGHGRNLYLDYRQGDFDSLRSELRNTDWYDLLGDLSTDESWQLFRDQLLEYEQKYIPKQSVQKRKYKTIWMTHKASKLLRENRT